jgi:hypothetical protein
MALRLLLGCHDDGLEESVTWLVLYDGSEESVAWLVLYNGSKESVAWLLRRLGGVCRLAWDVVQHSEAVAWLV